MLSRHTDNMASFAPLTIEDPANRQIIALGSAARKDNLTARGAQRVCNLLTRLLNRFLRLPSECMAGATRITIHIA